MTNNQQKPVIIADPYESKKRERRKNIFNSIWVSALLFVLLFLFVGTDSPLSTRINGSLLITMLLFVPSFYLSIKGVSDEELAKISNPTGPTPYYIVNVVLRKGFWLTLIVVALILAAAILIEMQLGLG